VTALLFMALYFCVIGFATIKLRRIKDFHYRSTLAVQISVDQKTVN